MADPGFPVLGANVLYHWTFLFKFRSLADLVDLYIWSFVLYERPYLVLDLNLMEKLHVNHWFTVNWQFTAVIFSDVLNLSCLVNNEWTMYCCEQ